MNSSNPTQQSPKPALPDDLCDGCGPAMQGAMLVRHRDGAEEHVHLQTSRVFFMALILVTGLGPFAMSSFIPALPAIQETFGVSAGVSQLTISAALVSMAIGSLIYGNLADRLGRRPVLLAGVLLAVIGSVLAAVGANIWVVIAGRCLQSAGSTSGFVLARVIVKDVYGEQRASSVLGYVTAAMTLAPLLGPLLGGYLVEYASWRAVFVVITAVASVLFLVLFQKLPETRPSDVRGARALIPWSLFGTLLRRPVYWRMVIFGAALQSAFMAFVAAAPFILTSVFDLPISSYGWYFAVVPVGYFLGSLISGRFSEQLGSATLMRWGARGAVASCVLAVGLSLTGAFGAWGFFMPAALLALAQGAALPSAQVALLVAAEPNSGSGSGLFGAIQLSAGAVIAQIVGVVLATGTLGATLIMLGTTSVALLVGRHRAVLRAPGQF